MSRIYFHTKERTAEVYGSERHWLSSLADMLSWGVAERYVGSVTGLKDLRDDSKGNYEPHGRMANDPFYGRLEAKEQYHLWLHSSFHSLMAGDRSNGLVLGDSIEDAHSVAMTTAMAVAADYVRLGILIHARCEAFGYFEAEDARWAAGLINEAREHKIFRDNAGWDDVLDLFYAVAEGTIEGPIVMSYSVCESFPDQCTWKAPKCEICDGEGHMPHDTDAICWDCDGEGVLDDAYYDLTPDQRWNFGVDWLREQPQWLRISPKTINQTIGSDRTFFDWINRDPIHETPPTG